MVEDWLRAGSRIKADWAAMLEGLVSRSREPVKIPFVPLRISGRALRAVLEDMLPAILGPNPSLLTVILEDGRAIKAYAEDASQGVYEKLVRLPVDPDRERPLSREELVDLARSAGVEPGVVKEAETRFFELFTEEPEDLVEALALLAASGAEALRRGWIRFDPATRAEPLRRGGAPPPPAAELAGRLRLGREALAWIISRLVPEGRYGIGLSCTAGSGGLVLEVSEAGWTVREVEAESSTVSGLARELIERHGCGLAAAVRLPALARLMGDELTIADFLRGPGEHWAVETRSGLEGLLAALPRLASLLGLERDLEACDISFDSILGLVGDYLRHAAAYAAESGVTVRLADAGESTTILWDAEGVKEGKGSVGEGDADEANEPDEPLELDLSLVRRAISVLSSDPLAGVREAVPLEVMDEVSYATAVALVECRRPRGRLLLFGGPHQFFNRAWEGDSCAVFIEENGSAHVAENPSRPLVIEDQGRRIAFEGGDVKVELHLERAHARRDLHGAGSFVGTGKLAEWLPGLDVTRGLHRVTSCRAEFDGRKLQAEGGWMYLEEGRGRLLRWPFGATWHYASWLFPPGDCGSGVHVAPMLGRSTPQWWRRFLETATDGAVLLNTGEARPAGFETALDPGPPVRLVRDAARAGDTLLQYQVLSAALVPFDEDGQMLFRLRCLVTSARPSSVQAEPTRDGLARQVVGEGAGLVEIPVTLPGVPPEACACDVAFTETGASFRAHGRELLALESGGSRFLGPYEALPPTGPGGILRRMVRRASAILGREGGA